MIVNVRGCSGSGKTTLMYNLSKMYGSLPLRKDAIENGPIEAYWMPGINAHLIGKYETACGGMDTIKSMDEAAALIEKYAKKGNVLCEGLLMSGDVKRFAYLAKNYPVRVGFLNTPLEVCLKHVQKRRQERGEFGAFKAENSVSAFKSMFNTKKRLTAEGVDARWIDWTRAVEVVTGWLTEKVGSELVTPSNPTTA